MASYWKIDPDAPMLNFPPSQIAPPYIESYTPPALPNLGLSPLMQGATPSPFGYTGASVDANGNYIGVPSSGAVTYSAMEPYYGRLLNGEPTIPYPTDDELYGQSRKYYQEKIARENIDPIQRRVFTKAGTLVRDQPAMIVNTVNSADPQRLANFPDAYQKAAAMEKALNEMRPNPDPELALQREASYRQKIGRNIGSGMGVLNALGLLSTFMNPDPLDPLGQLIIRMSPESYPEQVNQLNTILERQRNMVY